MKTKTLTLIFLVILFNSYSMMSFAKYVSETPYGRLGEAVENGTTMEVELNFQRGFLKNDSRIIYPSSNERGIRCSYDINNQVLPRFFGSNNRYIDKKFKFKLRKSKKPATHEEFSLWELDTTNEPFVDRSVIQNIACEFRNNRSTHMLHFLYPILPEVEISILSIED